MGHEVVPQTIKFARKRHQKTFVGRAPPGPAGELRELPRPHTAVLKGRRLEGEGQPQENGSEDGKKEGADLATHPRTPSYGEVF